MFYFGKTMRIFAMFFLVFCIPAMVFAGMFDGLRDMTKSLNSVNNIKQVQEAFGQMNGNSLDPRMKQIMEKNQLSMLSREAKLYLKDKNYELALPKAEEALSLAKELINEESPALFQYRELAADANYGMGKEDRAVFLYLANINNSKSLGQNTKESITTPQGIRNIYSADKSLPVKSFLGLAKIYEESGRIDDAVQIYSDGLAVVETHNPWSKNSNAILLNTGMGRLYYRQGDYETAKEIFLKVIGAMESAHDSGKENLQALSALSQALNIASRGRKDNIILGMEAYESLGSTYFKLGEYENLDKFYSDQVQAFCKDLTVSNGGAFQPEVGGIKIDKLISSPCPPLHQHFALLFSEAGNREKAQEITLSLAKEQGARSEKYFNILYGEYLGRQYLDNSSKYLSSLIKIVHDSKDPLSVDKGFGVLLNDKGRFLDYKTRLLRAAKDTDKNKIKENYRNLNELNAKLTELSLTKSVVQPQEYGYIFANKLNLEIQISRALHEEIKSDFREYSPKDIYEKIPTRTLYIDIVKTDHFDSDTLSFSGRDYYAFLANKSGQVEIVKLGSAEKIDKLVARFHSIVNESVTLSHAPDETQLSKVLALLQVEVLNPFIEKLSQFEHLIISPDGSLNLLPFEILRTPEGKYLLEDFVITYATSGRDLVTSKEEFEKNNRAVIFADPLYDLGGDGRDKALTALDLKDKTLMRGAPWVFRGDGFSPLPDTQLEAKRVGDALKMMGGINLEIYQQDQALEEVLLTTESPRFLHVATHGYFFDSEDLKTVENDAINMSALHLLRENPMLRSGIVLAGANTSLREGIDYGVISAEKICQIDLRKTEMVVLSACNTGSGDIQSGQGVFGLQRSILTAGAQSLVMSSWSVPSQETSQLMGKFYSLMADGLSKADALRQAKLSVMKDSPNPFYWGAFVLVGHPKS